MKTVSASRLRAALATLVIGAAFGAPAAFAHESAPAGVQVSVSYRGDDHGDRRDTRDARDERLRMVVAERKAALRLEPRRNARTVAVVRNGEMLDVIRVRDGWATIDLGRRGTAFVPVRQLKEVKIVRHDADTRQDDNRSNDKGHDSRGH